MASSNGLLRGKVPSGLTCDGFGYGDGSGDGYGNLNCPDIFQLDPSEAD